MFQSFSKMNYLLRIQWDVLGFLDISVIFKKYLLVWSVWQLAILAIFNFGNLQFWQLAILATYNLTTFNPNNFQFWQFSILAIFKQNFWIDPRTRTRTYRLYGSCDQKYLIPFNLIYSIWQLLIKCLLI